MMCHDQALVPDRLEDTAAMGYPWQVLPIITPECSLSMMQAALETSMMCLWTRRNVHGCPILLPSRSCHLLTMTTWQSLLPPAVPHLPQLTPHHTVHAVASSLCWSLQTCPVPQHHMGPSLALPGARLATAHQLLELTQHGSTTWAHMGRTHCKGVAVGPLSRAQCGPASSCPLWKWAVQHLRLDKLQGDGFPQSLCSTCSSAEPALASARSCR